MTNFHTFGIVPPVIKKPTLDDLKADARAAQSTGSLERDTAQEPPKEDGSDLGFERMKSTPRILDNAELDKLIEVSEAHHSPASIADGIKDDAIRRSEVVWLRRSEGYEWLYRRIWDAVDHLNTEYFHFDIDGFQTSLQLTRYDSRNKGFYTWHMDTGQTNPTRKLSFTVQVSDPDSYRGGDLELFYKSKTEQAPRGRGSITVFPSFVMHRVTPVKKGTRYSLVAWMKGPRWR